MNICHPCIKILSFNQTYSQPDKNVRLFSITFTIKLCTCWHLTLDFQVPVQKSCHGGWVLDIENFVILVNLCQQVKSICPQSSSYTLMKGITFLFSVSSWRPVYRYIIENVAEKQTCSPHHHLL